MFVLYLHFTISHTIMKAWVYICILLFCLQSVFAQKLTPEEEALMTGDETTTEVIAIMDSLIRESPHQARYYYFKAYSLELEGKKNSSLELLNLALDLMPDSASLYEARAHLYASVNRLPSALADFSQALKLSTGMGKDFVLRALVNLGSAKIRLRDFKGAYKDLMRAYELDSTDVYVLNHIATLHNEFGEKEKALAYLHKIIETDSSFVSAYINIGFYLQGEEKWKETLAYFDKAVSVAEDDPLIYSNRSLTRLKLGDTEGALEDINHSIKLHPINSYAYKIRALLYLELGIKGLACRDLETALERGYRQEYGEEVDELLAQHCK